MHREVAVLLMRLAGMLPDSQYHDNQRNDQNASGNVCL
jgi:hypothetical protein